jgi:hypothetical protein
MKSLHPLTALVFCSALLWSSCRTEKALWIEVNEHGSRKTIAVTEGIARRFLDAMETKVRFTTKSKSELLTREMVRDVLDGRTRSATTRDEHGTEVTISMKPLGIPGDSRENNRLVLDIYSSGERTFHLALPELDIELADKERQISLRADIDWKSWLPFLAKAGGAVYIKDHDEDTEVWLHVE